MLWLSISINFFTCTWEELYTGILELPVINGVNEGMIIVCGVEIFTIFVGQDFWLESIVIKEHTFRYNNLAVILLFVASIPYTIMNVVKTLKHPETKSIFNALFSISGMVLLCLTMILTFSLPISSQSSIFVHDPKLILILFGFPFAKLVGHMQIAHLAKAEFEQYRKTLSIFIFAFFILPVLSVFKDISGIIDYIIVFFIIFNFLAWVHFAYYVSGEMCLILDIERFTVKKLLISKSGIEKENKVMSLESVSISTTNVGYENVGGNSDRIVI